MAWSDIKQYFFSPKYKTLEINGRSWRFYAVSVKMLFKLQGVGKPLIKALATLFGEKGADRAFKKNTAYSPSLDPKKAVLEGFSEDVAAVSVGMAKYRAECRDKAIDDLVVSLTEEDNLALLSEIVMNSLKDDFAHYDDRPPASEFIDVCGIPTFLLLLKGVLEANVGSLGPLGQKAVDAAKTVLGRVDQQVEKEIQETAGISSKTPLSTSASEDGT